MNRKTETQHRTDPRFPPLVIPKHPRCMQRRRLLTRGQATRWKSDARKRVRALPNCFCGKLCMNTFRAQEGHVGK